ncbi:hypothetical protein ACW9H9_18715 [Pseudomonas sp. SDO5215_S409]
MGRLRQPRNLAYSGDPQAVNPGLFPYWSSDCSLQQGNRAFELHPVNGLCAGGETYNVDNVRVNTPKNPRHIHRKQTDENTVL